MLNTERMRRYVTTAIDYPNAAPHMGHVLEKVLADVLARWFRLCGDDVRFQIGTDEHGIKIQQTAAREKVTPQELVDANVPLFQELYAKLNVSADDFVRTTDQKRHWPTVQALWKKLADAGVLEKRTYTGLYCSGCERFVTAKDLVDGKCPDHNVAPQEVAEENWFFRLKDEQVFLEKILTDGTYRIVPEYRANETLQLLKSGLEDVSFSRPKSSLSWGIPVPGEENQVMYVWCDALTNYISTLGLLTDNHAAQYWNDAEVTHVIGKDIARFHALIWPAMLKNAGLRTPDKLLIHGFLTSEGQKMSKSLGNVVRPEEALAHFHGNPDPLRFYLTHEVPVGNDGDFSWKRIDEVYTSKLGNQLGNMLNRVLVMLKKEQTTLTVPVNDADVQATAGQWATWNERFAEYDLHGALGHVMSGVDAMNRAFNDSQPWKLAGAEKITSLSTFAECLRHAALMLLPFVPETAKRMSEQLNVPYAGEMLNKNFVLKNTQRDLTKWGALGDAWQTTGEPSILFPPLS